MTNTQGIRPALQAADRNLELEVKRRQTIGQLRRVALDIAGNMYGISHETAEVVTFQDYLEKSFGAFVEAMRSPTTAATYVAPDAARALLTAQSPAAQVEVPASKPGE